ncbi:MAG TPA: hypothetical protein VNV43_03805 [Candidatus Acidoferrales bacterium]|jgi:hypothetical protein|nr:hypothetical protein [Candidatus Acidoferrales bacterium]
MSNNTDYLGTLEAAIRIQHQCKPTYRNTVFVEEKTADDEIVWQGDVESFDLTGHVEARVCYSWQHIDGTGEVKIFAVLGSRFIDSPNKAVQAAIITNAQPPGHRFSKEMELLKQQLEECKKLFRQMGMRIEDLAAAIHAG